MNKIPRNESPDLDLAYKGMVPWSTKEFYDVYAKYATKKFNKKNENADQEMLLAETFRKEYPNELEFTAHLYRYHLMRKFILLFGRQMVQDGFAAPNGKPGLRDELMDVLCTLPYSKAEKDMDGEKIYNFSYPEVKAAALKKVNAHLN